MISEDKIAAVKRSLRKGEPEGEIKEQLRIEGHTEEDIRRVFTPHKYDMRSWYLFFAVLVSLSGLLIFSRTGGLLILVLGALLFVAYYYELRRLKRQT